MCAGTRGAEGLDDCATRRQSVPMSSHTSLIEQAHGGASNGAHKGQLRSFGGQAHEARLHVEVAVGGGGVKHMVWQIVEHVLPGPFVWGAMRPEARHEHVSERARGSSRLKGRQLPQAYGAQMQHDMRRHRQEPHRAPWNHEPADTALTTHETPTTL